MKSLNELRIDFMRHRHVWVAISGALVLLSLLELFFFARLNLGIDFAGGTQLIVRFAERPDLDVVREVLGGAGLGTVQIQRFGEEERNEVIIKTPLLPDQVEGSRDVVIRALESRFGSGAGRSDLNQIGAVTTTDLLYQADPDGQLALGETTAREHYREAADRIMEVRRDRGVLRSWEDLEGVEGVSEAALAALRGRATLGQFTVVSAENVGPQIGSELRTRGVLAVVLSLLGMLAYIWYRFEFRFGVGAMVAAAHDVIVTLGFYALLGYEFNLTTIAAFLTLVGYSVNDTVVIFDRVRENMLRPKRVPLIDVINGSLNETLSRTAMTSGTTLLAVLALFLLGGDVLRGLSFVLFFGVVVGTYSSIYVASAMVLYWDRRYGGKRARSAVKTSARPAATVPEASAAGSAARNRAKAKARRVPGS